MKRDLSHLSLGAVATLAVLAGSVLGVAPAQAAGPFQYSALTPCRIVDTRNPPGTNGGPRIGGNAPPRSFQMQGNCGVPVGAKAVTINVTIVTPSSTGFLTLWPSDGAQPTVSTLDWGTSDVALANGAIVPLATNTPDLAAFMGGGTGTTDVLIDVTGYFQ
jgi:hypothetical protein